MFVSLPRGAVRAAALVSLVVSLPLIAGAVPNEAQWSTYLGGNGPDYVAALTELNGYVVAVGRTKSESLAPDAGTTVERPSQDIFVARFDPSDGQLVEDVTTSVKVFGGDGDDTPNAVAAGPNGVLYIVGSTTSSSVSGMGPVIGTKATNVATVPDAFLTRIDAQGNPDWFLYLSGSGEDVATGVTVIDGIVYVSGWTNSSNFMGTLGTQPIPNAFVVRVEPTEFTATIGWGEDPLLIGGSRSDKLSGITADLTQKKLLAVGTTTSLGMPYDAKVLNAYKGGISDAFVVKLDVSGALEWVTYVGGEGEDQGSAITPGKSGSFVMAGTTDSPSLVSGTLPAGKNAFVAWVNGAGKTRGIQVRGGSGVDEALSLAVDSDFGTAYVGGRTASADFRGADAGFDPAIENAVDANPREGFVWMAPAAGGEGWASFVGAGGTDAVSSLCLVDSGRVIVGMQTSSSTGMPGTPYHYDDSAAVVPDGYLLSVKVNDPSPPANGTQPQVTLTVVPTPPTSSISVSWDPFNDFALPNKTPIVKYEWALGTLEEPTQVTEFESVGLALSAQKSGVALPAGRYVATVRAQDEHGLTEIATSDEVVVTDPSAPDGGTGGEDGGTPGPDGGTGGEDGGTSGPDGGTPGPDGGSPGSDGGSGDGDGGELESPVGWGCSSAGGAGVPLFLGFLALVLLGRRLRQPFQ